MEWCLLASFVKDFETEEKIDKISRVLNIDQKTIFVLSNLSKPNEQILTYNVLKENLDNITICEIINNTTMIHRNKKTNTLYSLNALNMLSNDDNSMDWEKYRNNIIVCYKGELQIFKTKLIKKGSFKYKAG
jgi:hypothetical protein